MRALFPAWSNTALRLGLTLLGLMVIGSLLGFMGYVRSPWNTNQYEAVDQPVEFDHRHHVIDDEIECLYCHREAEVSASAGIPSTDVCMGCHAQVWNESPLLEPVRRSYFSGQPIPWNRVHDLPDFTYFNHAVHVQRGVGCVKCHGRVDEMPRVAKVFSLQMQWCLDCHRNPNESLQDRPPPGPIYSSLFGVDRGDVHSSSKQGTGATLELTSIDYLVTCSACHR
jgi:hypothetical protein